MLRRRPGAELRVSLLHVASYENLKRNSSASRTASARRKKERNNKCAALA